MRFDVRRNSQPPPQTEADSLGISHLYSQIFDQASIPIRNITWNITQYWTSESRSATGLLCAIGHKNSAHALRIVDHLINSFSTAPQEQWNSLVSSMLYVASVTEAGTREYLHGKTGQRLDTALNPIRWEFLSIFQASLVQNDLGLILESGATRALIRKSAIEFIQEALLIDDPLESLDRNTQPSQVLAASVASIAEISPFFFSHALTELGDELISYAPTAIDKGPACDGLAQVYLEIAKIGLYEREAVIDHLFEMAKSSYISGAEMCGRVLRRLEEDFGWEKKLYDRCFDAIGDAENSNEKSNFITMASEYSLYNPDTAVACLKRFSRFFKDASLEDASLYAFGASHILDPYNHEANHFDEGYQTILNFISDVPPAYLNEDERHAQKSLIEDFSSISSSLGYKADIHRAVFLCLEKVSRPSCCYFNEIESVLKDFASRHPDYTLEGCIKYIEANRLTTPSLTTLLEIIEPSLNSTKITPKILNDLCIALGKTHCIDFVETQKLSPHMELLGKVRKMRDYLHGFEASDSRWLVDNTGKPEEPTS